MDRINGVPNAITASGPARNVPPDFARFQRMAELLQAAQDRELAAVRTVESVTPVGGALPADAATAAALVEAAKNGLEYHRPEDGHSWVLVRKDRRLVVEVFPGAENSPELIEAETILNLVPGQGRYEIVTAARGSPDPARFPTPSAAELRVVSRSTAQVLFFLANGVEVPPEHLNCGLVRPAPGVDGREITRGLFEVHVCHGKKPPPSAFVAVHYRGYWFYVDDADQATKATLSLLLQVDRMDFSQRLPGGWRPALTLPASR